MADIVDDASDLEAMHLQHALAAARAGTPVPMFAGGECYFCGEATEQGRRWCDSDCRDLWEERFERRRA